METPDVRIAQVEARMKGVRAPTPEVELVRSLPGMGSILATVIALEVGDADGFPVLRTLLPMRARYRGFSKAGARSSMGKRGRM